MRKIALLSLLTIILAGCSIGQQAKELQTLADCEYRIERVNSINISGVDVQKLIANRDINLTSVPSLALGFLSRNIPLNADLVIGITNPTNNSAAINYFDYEILINSQKLTEGTIDQPINIRAKETSEVDLTLTANVYKFLANDSIRHNIQQFIEATQNNVEETATIMIRIKPAIHIGETLVKYPSFIEIKRELSSNLLRGL